MFEIVKKVFCEKLCISYDQITMDSLIGEDLGADSLDMIDVIITLEDELGISFKNDDFSDIETVRDVMSFINREREEV